MTVYNYKTSLTGHTTKTYWYIDVRESVVGYRCNKEDHAHIKLGIVT